MGRGWSTVSARLGNKRECSHGAPQLARQILISRTPRLCTVRGPRLWLLHHLQTALQPLLKQVHPALDLQEAAGKADRRTVRTSEAPPCSQTVHRLAAPLWLATGHAHGQAQVGWVGWGVGVGGWVVGVGCGVCVGWGGGRGAGGTCNPLIAQTGAPRSRNRVTVQASPLAAGLARPVAGSPLVAQQHAALPGKVVCQLRLIVTLHGGRSRLGLSSKQVRGCGCKAVLAGLHLVDGVGRQARAKQTADPPRAARPSCASRMAVQLAGGPWGPAPALHPPAGSWWRRCGRAGAPGRGRMPAPPPPPASKTGKHHTLNQLSFAELCLWQHPWQGGKAQ